MSDKRVNEANIESKVPREQKLRGVDESETANTSCEETSETGYHYEPVITVTKQESSITKGDIKVQKITVTEDVSEEAETKAENIVQETNENEGEQMAQTAVEIINVQDRSDDTEIPQNEDKKAKTKIPMLKLRRAMREITESRKKLEESDKEIPVQKRKSSIPRLKDVKPPTLLTNNTYKEEPMSIVTPRTDEEFDKIFEEIVVKENSPSFIKDPEKLDSKFEELIHAYDDNKAEPINIEKNKSKIPMLKRKSEHDIEITKQIDHKSSHKKRLSIDNTLNSSSHPKSLTLKSTSTENKSNHETETQTVKTPMKVQDKNDVEIQASTTESKPVKNVKEINPINLPVFDNNNENLPSKNSDVSTFIANKVDSDKNTKFNVSKSDSQDCGIERNPVLKKSFSVDNNSPENTSRQKNIEHNIIRRSVSHQNENTYDALSSNILVQKVVKGQEKLISANTEKNYSFNNNVTSDEYLSNSNVQNSTDKSTTYKSVKYDSACQETSTLIRKIPNASEPNISENTENINVNINASDTSNIETLSKYSNIEVSHPSNNIAIIINKENNSNDPVIYRNAVLINNISSLVSEVTTENIENKLEEKVEEQIVSNALPESNNKDISTFHPFPQIHDEHESPSQQSENEKSNHHEDITQIVYDDKTASEKNLLDVQKSVTTVEEGLSKANNVNINASDTLNIETLSKYSNIEVSQPSNNIAIIINKENISNDPVIYRNAVLINNFSSLVSEVTTENIENKLEEKVEEQIVSNTLPESNNKDISTFQPFPQIHDEHESPSQQSENEKSNHHEDITQIVYDDKTASEKNILDVQTSVTTVEEGLSKANNVNINASDTLNIETLSKYSNIEVSQPSNNIAIIINKENNSNDPVIYRNAVLINNFSSLVSEVTTENIENKLEEKVEEQIVSNTLPESNNKDISTFQPFPQIHDEHESPSQQSENEKSNPHEDITHIVNDDKTASEKNILDVQKSVTTVEEGLSKANNVNINASDTSNIKTLSKYSNIEVSQPSNNIAIIINKENNSNDPVIYRNAVIIDYISSLVSEVKKENIENKLEEKVEEQIVSNALPESNNKDISTFQPLPQIHDEHESPNQQSENEKSNPHEDITHIVNDDKTASEKNILDVQTSVTTVEEGLSKANNVNINASDTSNIETLSKYSNIEVSQPSNNIAIIINKENNSNDPVIYRNAVIIDYISSLVSEVTTENIENKLEEKVEEHIVSNALPESNNKDISTFQPFPQIHEEHESPSQQSENEKSNPHEDTTHIVNDNKTASEKNILDVQTSVTTVEEGLTKANNGNSKASQKEVTLEQVTEQGKLSTLEHIKKPTPPRDTSSPLINKNVEEYLVTNNNQIANTQNPKDTHTHNDIELNKIANSRRFEENPNDIANSYINKHIEDIKERRMQDKNLINDLLKSDMPEEDIIILKGKVNRVISRLDSKDYSEGKTKLNIVDEVSNKAVLSKIALFEQKDAVIENNTLKKTSRSHSQTPGDLPKIVDGVLKTQAKIDSTTDKNKIEISKISPKTKVTWSKIDKIDNNKKVDFDKINNKKKFSLKSIESDEIFDEKYKIKKETPRIEIKRELSYAETDLGDSVRGKVRQMVVRMVSLERVDLEKTGIIDIKNKPRSGSVSEKIALFEKQVTPLKTSKANASKNQTKEVSEENMSEEELNRKVEELLGAKKNYGRITDLKYIELNDGCMMPAIGVGTALLNKKLTKLIVSTAIELGYRTIDTAYIYGNEKEIGEAINEKISDGTVKREDLFIISKLWSTFHRRDLVEKACKLSLKAMGLEYFDLYLIHNPMSFKEGGAPIPKIANVIQYSESDYLDAWYGVEHVVKKGLARRAGVSNFNSAQLDRIIDKGRIKPVVNQVECHPYFTQYRLDEFCQSRDVKMSSYGVLGSKGTPLELKSGLSPVIDDPMVLTMAAGLNVTPAQLLISYQLHLDHGVIVKASSGSHLWSNLQAQQVRLETSHISALNALNRNKRNFTFKGFGDTHRNYPFRIPF